MPLKPSVLILLLLLSLSHTAFAAQPRANTQVDTEAKRAAEEEEAEKSLNGEDSRKDPCLYGKVTLSPPDPDRKDKVIGTFTVGPKQYFLKVEKDDLRIALSDYNGKEVSLQGKIRNDGKYFIALIIFGAGAPPSQLRNSEGL
jgi:hypothetical protein